MALGASSAFLLAMSCAGPCEQLSQQICACEPNINQEAACLDEVQVNDERDLSEADELRCEGIDSEAVRTYVTDAKRRSLLLDFARSYPGMLLHGGLSEAIPAEPGGASGVITISVPGRVRDSEALNRFVSDVCDFATQLDAKT